MSKLTTAARKDLPASEFAMPMLRKYPIDTMARAMNALARVSQFGSPADQAQVRARVKKKYPNIGQSKKNSLAKKRIARKS